MPSAAYSTRVSRSRTSTAVRRTADGALSSRFTKRYDRPVTTVPTTSPDRAGTSLSRALTLAHTHRAALRSDLTERLGLTRTATGLVLRELETLSLIRTVTSSRADPGVPTTGRPSHAIEIHPDAPTVLAVQVQATSVLIAPARLGGVLGQVDEVPLPESTTPASVLGLIADLLAARYSTTDRAPFGVGARPAVGRRLGRHGARRPSPRLAACRARPRSAHRPAESRRPRRRSGARRQ